MTKSDITSVYAYKRDMLPSVDERTRSRDPDASHAIKDCFLAYGWSSEELLRSNTTVVAILKRHLSGKRPHAGFGPEDPESAHKRWRVDEAQQAYDSCPHRDILATSSDQLAMPYSDLNRTASAEVNNNLDNTPGSTSSYLKLSSTRDWTRDLADAATISNLGYAFQTSAQLEDPATTDILNHTVNSLGDFTDLLSIYNSNTASTA